MFSQCDSPKADEIVSDALTQQFDADFKRFFSYMNNEEWDEMMDMTNPQIFNIAPREALINMFKGQKAAGISITVTDTKVKSYTDIMEFQGIYYTKVTYEGTMKMVLKEALMSNLELFKIELYKSYDKDQVSIDERNNQIVIEADKQIVATSNDDKKSWNYFEIQEDQKHLLVKILPKEVYDKLIVNG